MLSSIGLLLPAASWPAKRPKPSSVHDAARSIYVCGEVSKTFKSPLRNARDRCVAWKWYWVADRWMWGQQTIHRLKSEEDKPRRWCLKNSVAKPWNKVALDGAGVRWAERLVTGDAGELIRSWEEPFGFENAGNQVTGFHKRSKVTFLSQHLIMCYDSWVWKPHYRLNVIWE